jgi:hypothetical protein
MNALEVEHNRLLSEGRISPSPGTCVFCHDKPKSGYTHVDLVLSLNQFSPPPAGAVRVSDNPGGDPNPQVPSFDHDTEETGANHAPRQ